eukprot:scaffold4461_cov215-Prasinococcus_capsulatus_cf.AAC.1
MPPTCFRVGRHLDTATTSSSIGEGPTTSRSARGWEDMLARARLHHAPAVRRPSRPRPRSARGPRRGPRRFVPTAATRRPRRRACGRQPTNRSNTRPSKHAREMLLGRRAHRPRHRPRRVGRARSDPVPVGVLGRVGARRGGESACVFAAPLRSRRRRFTRGPAREGAAERAAVPRPTRVRPRCGWMDGQMDERERPHARTHAQARARERTSARTHEGTKHHRHRPHRLYAAAAADCGRPAERVPRVA